MATKRKMGNKDVRLYCVCKKMFEDSDEMIGCDMCDEWYHLTCMGVTVQEAAEDKWFCNECVKIMLYNPSLSTKGIGTAD